MTVYYHVVHDATVTWGMACGLFVLYVVYLAYRTMLRPWKHHH